VCSRREAERWIAAGRVQVNGALASSPRPPVDPARDVVLVDGLRVGAALDRLVLAFHKPVGVVTTRHDPGGRPTVYDVLEGVDRWVFPVGRLDRDTSGLLILTNDVALGHRLTHPEHHVPRTYHARVRGLPDPEALRALSEGLDPGDGVPTRPADVRLLGSPRPDASPLSGTSWLELVLTEGRNRQVRRMCAAVGHDVLDLVRVRIGTLDLGDLPPGAWRPLTRGQVVNVESCPPERSVEES
jgi:pseudouridine synthase